MGGKCKGSSKIKFSDDLFVFIGKEEEYFKSVL